MTEQEILQKAIEKAVENGWYHEIYGKDLKALFFELFESTEQTIAYQEIIFSHDFAKCFWNDEELNEDATYIKLGKEDVEEGKSWQYHLQQLVLEKEPIKYLEQFIEQNT